MIICIGTSTERLLVHRFTGQIGGSEATVSHVFRPAFKAFTSLFKMSLKRSWGLPERCTVPTSWETVSFW